MKKILILTTLFGVTASFLPATETTTEAQAATDTEHGDPLAWGSYCLSESLYQLNYSLWYIDYALQSLTLSDDERQKYQSIYDRLKTHLDTLASIYDEFPYIEPETENQTEATAPTEPVAPTE